jgi:uncharacterized protein
VLDSERIGKELAGIPAEQQSPAPYQAGIYSPSWTERTYDELLHRAAELLSHGESVIADASWISAGHRAAAAATAEGAAAGIVQLRCTAPAELTARRMSSRTGGVSDAGPEVAERMAQEQAPWPQAITIDTSGPEPLGAATSSGPVQRALEAIRPRESEHLWRPARPYMLPD